MSSLGFSDVSPPDTDSTILIGGLVGTSDNWDFVGWKTEFFKGSVDSVGMEVGELVGKEETKSVDPKNWGTGTENHSCFLKAPPEEGFFENKAVFQEM